MGEPLKRTSRLSSLEALRGIAALALVFYHTRFIPPLAAPASFDAVLATLGAGVPLFYAISAFSLFLGYEHVLEKPEGLKKFFLRRFFRIAPLFYTMLVLWLLLRHYHFHAPTKGRDVLLNAAFVFGLLPGQHEGLVWASWSIGVEWIFYGLFPLFLVLARTRWSAAVLFGVGLFISVSAYRVLANLSAVSPTFAFMCFPSQLAFFCAGVLAYRVARPNQDVEPAWLKSTGPAFSWLLVVAGLLWIASAWTGALKLPLNRAHLAVHWSSIAWIALLLGAAKGLPWIIDNSVLRYAGRLSFGLYLTNPPVIYSLGKLGVFNWFFHHIASPAWAFVVCAFTAVVSVGIAAQLAFSLVENPGIHLGERVWKRLQESFPAKAPSSPVAKGFGPPEFAAAGQTGQPSTLGISAAGEAGFLNSETKN